LIARAAIYSLLIRKRKMQRHPLLLGNRLPALLAIAALSSFLNPLLANGPDQDVVRVARLSAPHRPTKHPIDPALAIASSSLGHLQDNIEDYTAIFVKRCRVDGVLPPLQYARLKIRTRKISDGHIASPLSVYLDFLKPKSVKGREVIWIENENEGNMIVHQGGLASLLTLQIDPEGMLAMRGQRYSIREIGLENLLRKIVDTAHSDRQHGECEVEIRRDATFGTTECTLIEITHPVKRDHFRFHQARVYFDNELNLPIRYQAWVWPESPGGIPILDEEYNYFNLNVNGGLSASDFDSANPKYRFR
jgi:hypothetical protein